MSLPGQRLRTASQIVLIWVVHKVNSRALTVADVKRDDREKCVQVSIILDKGGRGAGERRGARPKAHWRLFEDSFVVNISSTREAFLYFHNLVFGNRKLAREMVNVAICVLFSFYFLPMNPSFPLFLNRKPITRQHVEDSRHSLMSAKNLHG